MNAHDVLKYGHLWVHKHLNGLSEEQWNTPGVCGIWSVKDILAHLASYEYVLVDVFRHCLEGSETPHIATLTSQDGNAFNAQQVGMRKNWSVKQVIEDYNQQVEAGMALVARMSEQDLRKVGSLPWYGNEYSIEDFIVYQYYGHKREHCAQIAVYRDTL